MKKVDRYVFPAVTSGEDESAALERGMNFSQVLQEALRARIGV